MAILQKHGKNSSPDLAGVKDGSADNFESAGHQKKWPESTQSWSRWVSWVSERARAVILWAESQIDTFLPA